MNVFDVRVKPSDAPGYFLSLGRKRTVKFEWENYDQQGRNYGSHGWAGMLGGLVAELPINGCTDLFVPYHTTEPTLFLDDSRDSFKWPALRSVHSPEVRLWLTALRDRALLPDITRVCFGNWGSVEEEEFLGYLGVLLDAPPAPVVLYHGTNTYRWALAQETGRLHTLPEKERVWRDKVPEDRKEFIYFSTSPRRAAYYAEKACAVDRRRGRKGTQPVVLKLPLASDLRPRLRADDDYLARADIHEGKTDIVTNAWDSLALFGQVAIDGPVELARLKRVAA